MTITEARAAIGAILAAIPDEDLDDFYRVEVEADGTVLAWNGGRGRVLGSAKRGDERDPENYHRNASHEAIESEAMYRLDLRFFENGDKLEGSGIEAAVREAVDA